MLSVEFFLNNCTCMFDLHYFDHSFAFSLRYCVLFDAWDLRVAESDTTGKEGLVS